MNTPLLCIKTVCAQLGICRSTLSEYRKTGHFPEPCVVFGGRPRWRAEQIDEFLRRGGMLSVPQRDSTKSASTPAGAQA